MDKKLPEIEEVSEDETPFLVHSGSLQPVGSQSIGIKIPSIKAVVATVIAPPSIEGPLVAAPCLKGVDEEEAWLRFYFNPFTPAEEKKAIVLGSQTLHQLAAVHDRAVAHDKVHEKVTHDKAVIHEMSGHERGVSIPLYDRDPKSVTHWIMHLGVGQFHRSHQLVYLDDLLNIQYKDHHRSDSGISDSDDVFLYYEIVLLMS